MTERKWPTQLWIVRHGQSAGNVASDLAESKMELSIDLATRDGDTPLSALGVQQAGALGQWFGQMPESMRPTIVLTSPYLRAMDTTSIMLNAAGIERQRGIHLFVDERLREKEFGIFDCLTRLGIRQKYPELAAQRQYMGKFYFRPPGGESWCDVILRLRSVIDALARDYPGERVLIVAHRVILICFRYLLEQLDEQSILAIDLASDVPNCGVMSYPIDAAHHHGRKLTPALVNFVIPLQAAGTPVTVAPDQADKA
ncbi:MAG: histidine phosphatase family protein [Pseudomonadota bacterium]